MQQKVDSLKSANDNEIKRMKDSLQKEKDEINQKLEKLDKRTVSNQNNCGQKPESEFTFIMYI